MAKTYDHNASTIAGHGDKGSFGRGDFGPGPTRGVTGHVIQHPSRQSAPEEDLGAEPLPADRLVDEVKARLAKESFPDDRIDVRREGRHILLEGEVKSERHLTLAKMVAQGTPGVTEVHCALKVA